MLRTVNATRYVAPLREGGSLPAIIEADDDGMYVLKFRRAGQGPKVLIAELICGEVGRALGLPVPEIVFVELDAALGRNEPDSEIQALVSASAGLNIALDYLPGSLGFDALDTPRVDPALAAAIIWFDAYFTNVDRTPRNTNMLWWHRKLWLIDHGAALYVHHTWTDRHTRARGRFPAIKEHVLLAAAGDIAAADARLAPLIDEALIDRILTAIPNAWFEGDGEFATPESHRTAYRKYLLDRLASPRAFVEEAINARAQRV